MRQRRIQLATSHAGEILQGALHHQGRSRRLLLSLPAPSLWTQASVHATPGEPMRVEPAWASKAQRAASLLLARLGRRPPEVTIRLHTNIPSGKGCGSSTADVLATVRCLLAELKVTLPEEQIARFVVEVEEASDGSMLSRPALFRHREGVVEAYLDGAFPPMQVLVVDAQPDAIVETTSLPRARYSDSQFAAFRHLVKRLKRAFRQGNPHEVGRVATASARISEQFLPKPHFEEFLRLIHREGGYGLAVSHSGTVMSALLPLQLPAAGRDRLLRALDRWGQRVLTRYSLGSRVPV